MVYLSKEEWETPLKSIRNLSRVEIKIDIGKESLKKICLVKKTIESKVLVTTSSQGGTNNNHWMIHPINDIEIWM